MRRIQKSIHRAKGRERRRRGAAAEAERGGAEVKGEEPEAEREGEEEKADVQKGNERMEAGGNAAECGVNERSEMAETGQKSIPAAASNRHRSKSSRKGTVPLRLTGTDLSGNRKERGKHQRSPPCRDCWKFPFQEEDEPKRNGEIDERWSQR